MRILLIDDSFQFSDVLIKLLTATHDEVVLALDFYEAEELLKNKQFGAIILDMNMPLTKSLLAYKQETYGSLITGLVWYNYFGKKLIPANTKIILCSAYSKLSIENRIERSNYQFDLFKKFDFINKSDTLLQKKLMNILTISESR